MALTPDQKNLVDQLRRLAGSAAAGYSDDELWAIITENDGKLNPAASNLWLSTAAKYAHLVDISEGSSTRKLSSYYKQALEMADHFGTADEEIVPEGGRTRTVRIMRT